MLKDAIVQSRRVPTFSTPSEIDCRAGSAYRSRGLLAQAYERYATAPLLARALREDVASHFAVVPDPAQIVQVTITCINQIATLRNLTGFRPEPHLSLEQALSA